MNHYDFDLQKCTSNRGKDVATGVAGMLAGAFTGPFSFAFAFGTALWTTYNTDMSCRKHAKNVANRCLRYRNVPRQL